MIGGNNVTYSDEIGRRMVSIHLDAKMADPTEGRKFKHKLEEWVPAHRGKLVWACLTLIQAWVKAGKPSGKIVLASFSDWSRVMGGILGVAGVDGFLTDRQQIKEGRADASATMMRFVDAAYARFGVRKEIKVGKLEWNSTATREPEDLVNLLLKLTIEDNVDFWFTAKKNKEAWCNYLGQELTARKDNVFAMDDGVSVALRKRATRNGIRYILEEVASLPKEDEGEGMDASALFAENG